jgi:hypothetical protein
VEFYLEFALGLDGALENRVLFLYLLDCRCMEPIELGEQLEDREVDGADQVSANLRSLCGRCGRDAADPSTGLTQTCERGSKVHEFG